MKNAISCYVTQCGSRKNRHFRETYCIHHQLALLRSMLQLLAIANIPRLPILFTLMMEEICSSQTSVLTRATRRHITQDGDLHSHCCENQLYIALTAWTL
jgi:hypothetical protein